MMNYEKTSKKKTKQKTYKQRDNDSVHGKIRYRIRITLEKEGQQQVREFNSNVS